ncbi:MAG: ankyrin repeat domain-containing protein [Candidatus Riflebacteria bacterium]|nr:ankyrin repeat domain-containing protein [Candidatus Riflebacteria bacterium]
MREHLLTAISRKGYRLVQDLIAAGADINGADNEGITPLMHAVLFSDLAMVDFLIRHGAAVNPRDLRGWTALHFATDSRCWSIMKTLLASGAEADTQDATGNTPLRKALLTSSPSFDIICILLENGANPYRKNADGSSPMDLVQKLRKTELIELLRNGPSRSHGNVTAPSAPASTSTVATGTGERPGASTVRPFMEHPTGQFGSAIDAMDDAVKRLRELATSRQVALFLDAIFRYHFGVRPSSDLGSDYAVGAEW